jgi:hypothetical protein
MTNNHSPAISIRFANEFENEINSILDEFYGDE